MMSTELVQGLETNVQLGRVRILGKICYHKVLLCSELSKDFWWRTEKTTSELEKQNKMK